MGLQWVEEEGVHEEVTALLEGAAGGTLEAGADWWVGEELVLWAYGKWMAMLLSLEEEEDLSPYNAMNLETGEKTVALPD